MKRYFNRIIEVFMQKVLRRSFTDDFKAQAVSLSETLGRTGAARKLGISVKSLENWVTQARRAAVFDLSGQPARGLSPAATHRRRVHHASCRWNTLSRYFLIASHTT
jgi:transposase-like protein